MMKSEGKNVASILLTGMVHLQLCHFPCYRVKPKFHWANNQVFQVLYEDIAADDNYFDVDILTANVISELEHQNLVFRSKFNSRRDAFPWIFNTCNRLRGMELDAQQLLYVLTFVSCVCLVQNGCYVNFQSLLKYLQGLPISQKDLQDLKILSAFYLRGPLNNKLFRIYEDIPYQLNIQEPFKTFEDVDEEVPDEPQPVDVPAAEAHEIIPENVEVMPVRHVAGRCRVEWNSVEKDILKNIVAKGRRTYKLMYYDYVRECRRKGLPDRSLFSFKSAYVRLSNNPNT